MTSFAFILGVFPLVIAQGAGAEMRRTLGGRPIPLAPHRRTVYRLHELEEVVREFGLPPGYANVHEEFDVYIEAQVWDDQPLQESMPAGSWYNDFTERMVSYDRRDDGDGRKRDSKA